MLENSTKNKKVILTKNTVMERKNTENCTNVCKLTNCRLSTLILTNEKQDGCHCMVKQSRGQVTDAVQGWHFAEQVNRFAYKAFSGEKSTHKKRLCPFYYHLFETEPFESRSLLSFLRLTSTFF